MKIVINKQDCLYIFCKWKIREKINKKLKLIAGCKCGDPKCYTSSFTIYTIKILNHIKWQSP